MAITKRTRFEILRRDEHTCQYCGQMAPDVVLHVDHVIPVALGGSDDPSNLLTACRDCNAGKASIQPDSPLVSRISEVSATYALSMVDKFTRIKGRIEAEDQYVEVFTRQWNGWTTGQESKPVDLPADWKNSLRKWHQIGVPTQLVTHAVDVAMRTTKLAKADSFRYMAGIVWRTLEDESVTYPLSPETARTFTTAEANALAHEKYVNGREDGHAEGYSDGFHDGPIFEATRLSNQDFLALHIDGRVDHWAWELMSRAA